MRVCLCAYVCVCVCVLAGSEGSKTARRPSVSRAGPRRPTPSRTTRKTEPYIRVLHPAVIMDPALLHPCANPVAEVRV